MDYESICRCCLSKASELKNLYTPLKIGDKKEIVPNILQYCFDIEVRAGDGYPQNICVSCCKSLQTTFTFKCLVEKSKSILDEFSEVSNVDTGNGIDDSFDFDSDHNNSENENDVKSENDRMLELYSQWENPNKKAPEAQPLPTDEDKKNKLPRRDSQSSSGKNVLFCTECDMNFFTSQSLYDHTCIMHPKPQNTGRPCNYCNGKFADFKTLLVHRKKHINPHVCDYCMEEFNTANELSEHMLTCYKSTKRVSYYRRIKKIPPKNATSQCHFCGKSYPPGYIKVHMLIHGEGKYKCKFCDKTFKQPCSLNSHIVCVHKKTKTHKCGMCDAVFSVSGGRSAHIRKFHFKEKKHVCATCGKSFCERSSLRKHMTTHGEDRLFS